MRRGKPSLTVYGMVLVVLLIPLIMGFAVNSGAEGRGSFVVEVEQENYHLESGELTAVSSGDTILVHIEIYESLILDKEIASSEKKKDNSTQPMVFDIELTEKKNPKTDLLYLSLLFLMSVIILLLVLHIRMHKRGRDRTADKGVESEKMKSTDPLDKKAISEQQVSTPEVEHEFTSLPLALTVLDSIYQSQMPDEAAPMASMGPLMDFDEEEPGMDLGRGVEVGMDCERKVP